MTQAVSGPDRRSVTAWALYDLANTVFALGVIGRYFPEWLTSIGRPDRDLAIVEAVAGLAVILVAPWAGARSDAIGTRVPTLRSTTLIAVAATFALGTGPEGLTFALLGLALVAFNVGSVVYDALLVDVSTARNRSWVSGLGVAVGYVGSFVGLGIGLLGLEVLGWSYAAVFRALALAFLVFALPAFFMIREAPPRKGAQVPSPRAVAARTVQAWKDAAAYQGMIPFLVGRFLYADAINTLIGGFLTIFVLEELGMRSSEVTGLLALAIVAAIGGALLAGRVANRLGPLRVLRYVLLLWLVAMGSGIAAAVTGRHSLGWAIGALGGIALGATWASDRVVMTRISPPRRLGEFYGLYATVGRFATILGPLVWALVVDGLDLGRTVAMGALMLFVGAGWLILGRVDDGERQWSSADLPEVSGSPSPPI